MKKSKILLAIFLAIVLTITASGVPTFSWFTKPKTQVGNSLAFSDTANAYNGYNVSMSTAVSTDGNSYTPVNSSDSSAVAAALAGSGIEPEYRKYYKTTIANANDTAQNVSLYISKVLIPTSGNGNFCVGVNSPTRMFRNFTALSEPYHRGEGDAMRVYFQPNGINKWTGGDYYVCWAPAGVTLGSNGENGTYYHLMLSGQAGTFCTDIPTNANQLFFCVANWGSDSNTGSKNWKRTQTFTNLAGDGLSINQSLVFKLKNETANTYGNVKAETFNADGASFIHYYSDIMIAKDNTFDAHLTQNTDYKGKSSVTYTSKDTSVFTVNSSTGVITAVAAGEAQLETKIYGTSFNDTSTVLTTVTVTGADNYEFKDIPIAKSMEIPANSTKVIEWYIMNPKGSSNNLRYTLEGLYLGL